MVVVLNSGSWSAGLRRLELPGLPEVDVSFSRPSKTKVLRTRVVHPTFLYLSVF